MTVIMEAFDDYFPALQFIPFDLALMSEHMERDPVLVLSGSYFEKFITLFISKKTFLRLSALLQYERTG